jgi:hypothetical protein
MGTSFIERHQTPCNATTDLAGPTNAGNGINALMISMLPSRIPRTERAPRLEGLLGAALSGHREDLNGPARCS